MKHIDHPNIVKLYDVFEDDKQYQLVTELMTGGEVSSSNNKVQLFDYLVNDNPSEEIAQESIRPIIDAIHYCHSLDIIHRDLRVQFPFKRFSLRLCCGLLRTIPPQP